MLIYASMRPGPQICNNCSYALITATTVGL